MVDAKLAGSRNQARTLIRDKAVSLFAQGENGAAERITDSDFTLDAVDGAILKVGKLRYIRIKVQ
jgi:tyrosyl-tRNA synthetase